MIHTPMIHTAMIFAAGRGERMMPLTAHSPKPLLQVGGKSLLAWQLERLRAAGIKNIVINTSYLAERIQSDIGEGQGFGLNIRLIYEGNEPLETGGGIRNALSYLGDAPFLVCNGDVYSEFDYAELKLKPGALAQLVMVPNPEHHPDGDFAISNALCRTCGAEKWTFSGIGVYQPALFTSLPVGRYRLAPILKEAMAFGQVGCQVFNGLWTDVGTPQRLLALDQALHARL